MSGQFLGHFMLDLIASTKVISLKIAKFGSMDIVESHGDILQPGGQLETPGLVSPMFDLVKKGCLKSCRAYVCLELFSCTNSLICKRKNP